TSGGSTSTACRNNPCVNGGSCQSVPGGGFRCICRTGFTGNFCELSISTSGGSTSTACRNNPCVNGASCENVPGGGFRCICRAGFTGVFCTFPITG
ncbi:unnamed protein product, partial [Rotaria sp. Silwood2]